MADSGYDKRHRLRKRSQYLGLSRRGRRLDNAHFIAVFSRTAEPVPRLGVTVTKKVGSACVRSRLKRHVREVFRQGKHQLGPGIDVNVIAKKSAARASGSEVQESVRRLFSKVAERRG